MNQNKINWMEEFCDRLRDYSEGDVWCDGNMEILCRTESAANAISDMIETLYKSQGEDVLINTGYVEKIEPGLYNLVEGRYVEDKYLMCSGSICISDYLDQNGDYDEGCIRTINSYYDSVEEFKNNYADEEFREQVLAEMLFEDTPYYELNYRLVGEDEIETELKSFVGVIHNTNYTTMEIGKEYKDNYLGNVWKAVEKIPNGMRLQCISGSYAGKNGVLMDATPDTCRLEFIKV